MIVVARRLGRAVDLDTFTDITAVPVTSIEWGPDGELLIAFDGDLAASEQRSVRIRCASTDANEEQLLRAMVAAWTSNQRFLALPAPLTLTQIAEQVTALTRQINGQMRMDLNQLD